MTLVTAMSSPPESATWPPASSRSGLRLLCRLGQGGMAEVHLAARGDARGAAELCVVKRLHQHQVDDPASVRMFLDEAKLALSLSHPNIVHTQRLGTFGGRHGIVMEFLEGQPFHQLLKRAYQQEGTFNVDVLAQVAIAALDGLHYAHELKDASGVPLSIVHRDVSPQNLLVTYDGAVKLLDFGIAKNALQDGRTRTGLLKGKVSYMAPEQARGEELDRRADIWSLGVVLWEAATGSRLFKGANEAATLNMTLTDEVQAPSSRRPAIPADLERILMRALERDPAKRYASAAEMRDELELWLTGRELGPDASVLALMQRLFGAERAAQREQVRALLHAPAELAPESGTKLVPGLVASGTFSGLRETQLSSVTDLMQELTRQRRVTTRLLGVLIAVGVALLLAGVVAIAPRAAGPSASAATPEAAQSPGLQTAAALVPSEPHRPPDGTRKPEPATALSLNPKWVTPSPAPKAAALSPVLPTRPATASSTGASRHPSSGTNLEGSGSSEPETGRLNFDSTPWSIVSVGGRVLGQTPVVGVELPAGTHSLVLTNPELGLKTTYQVSIAPGRTTARRIGLE